MSKRTRPASTPNAAPAIAPTSKRARVQAPPPPPKPKAVKPKVPDVKKKVVVKPKVKPYVRKVKTIPLDFVSAAPSGSIETLLLQAASLSPEFDSLLKTSIASVTPLVEGTGRVQDFNKQNSAVQGLMRGEESGGEGWSYVVALVESIAPKVKTSSPLQTKLNALAALGRIEEAESIEASGGHSGEYAEGESTSELVSEGMLSVLSRMDEGERRSIDEKLVEKMDVSLRSRKSRELYGEEGREFKDLEPWGGCEEGDWKEVEEEEEEEEKHDWSKNLVCESLIPLLHLLHPNPDAVIVSL